MIPVMFYNIMEDLYSKSNTKECEKQNAKHF